MYCTCPYTVRSKCFFKDVVESCGKNMVLYCICIIVSTRKFSQGAFTFDYVIIL